MSNLLTLFREFQATRAMKRECAEFERRLAVMARPAPPELEQATTQRATWRIAVSGQADRFMSTTPGAIDDQMFVVRVGTEAFYAAWLKSSAAQRERTSADCVLRKDMPADYKYHHAAEGFAAGSENPVPLALVRAQREGDGVGIHFINGVTRSFWLIANQAESFPVQVHGREAAELLNSTVGLDRAPQSLRQVFAKARAEEQTLSRPMKDAAIVAAREQAAWRRDSYVHATPARKGRSM